MVIHVSPSVVILQPLHNVAVFEFTLSLGQILSSHPVLCVLSSGPPNIRYRPPLHSGGDTDKASAAGDDDEIGGEGREEMREMLYLSFENFLVGSVTEGYFAIAKQVVWVKQLLCQYFTEPQG